jgi:DNA polymerase-3 subunit beta
MKSKVTIDASQWKKALAMLSPVVGTKNALPILADVVLRFDSKRDIFTLTCSDSETWMTIDCADKEGQPWIHLIEDDLTDKFQEVAIQLAPLKEAVSLLPSAQLLEVSFKDTTMKVNYGIGEFEMSCEPADTFPQPLPVAAQGEDGALCSFTMGAEKLLPMMSAAVESTADDELRMVMNGVCLDVYYDKVIVVATNGHELFKDIIDTGVGSGWLEYGSFPASGSAKLIIAKKTRKALASAVTSGPLTVTADRQRVEFTAEGVRIMARMIEGNYPNYESVIPKDSQYRVTVCRDSLRLALCRLRLFADEGVQLAEIRRVGHEFVIRSASAENARSGSERIAIIEGDTFLPEDFSIGFKISIAISILDRITSENVVLILSEPNRPVLYKQDDMHSSRLILQMPMRVD